MAQVKDKPKIKGEMMTEEEIVKISMGICPWPNMKAPKKPDPQVENKRADAYHRDQMILPA